MSLDQRLLAALADGSPRSARSLAAELSTTHDRARYRLRQMQRQGWPIGAHRGLGYVLDADARPLDPYRIESGLADIAADVDRVVFWPTIGSTQAAVATEPVVDDGRVVVGIADRQTAGHGRRGRSWHAPPGGAITVSLARWLPQPPASLGPLAPGLGLAVAETLRASGITRAGVKWPNDVFIGHAKVGGVLVDAAGAGRGGARVVVGVGVNYELAAAHERNGPTDLCSALAHPPVRSDWVTAIVRALIMRLGQAARYGPAAAVAGWDDFDIYRDRCVRLTTPDEVIEGVAGGLDDMGALRVHTATGQRRLHSGQVSLRALERC